MSSVSVPDYDIVHPVEVKEGRTRRSSDENLEYKLKAFGKDMHLNLQKNKEFLGPDFHVEFLGEKGDSLIHFYSGANQVFMTA